MRRATLVIARWFTVVLLAIFCAYAATTANAQGAPNPPAQPDAHLDGLSDADLRQLLEKLTTVKRFTEDSILAFKAFLRERANGLRKNSAGKPLTVSERNAVRASTPVAADDWVTARLRTGEWNNIRTAGSTDQFGTVELVQPAIPSEAETPSALELAFAEEQRRTTILHESFHVADKIKAAGKIGLDFNKWQLWGALEGTVTTLLYESVLLPANLGHALWNLDEFISASGRNTASDGRYFAERARSTLTPEEIGLLVWFYKNRVKIDAYTALTNNPEHSAIDEIRAYSSQIPFMQSRIDAITARLSTATTGGSTTATPNRKTVTPKTHKTPKTATPTTPKTVAPTEPKTATPSEPKPTKTSQAPSGGYGDSEGASCFTAGTKVLMADGTEKLVETIRIGERVRGKNNTVNTVTGIERPRLGKRLLYAINGGRAFVTAEHPFWTADGWKSIDPRATFAENPRLTVGALAVGDRIAMRVEPGLTSAGNTALAISYAPSTSLQTIAIRSILGVTGDPDTRVYNLLLDGNHTYFVDGFLVHNKG